jgi:hypothetical protein
MPVKPEDVYVFVLLSARAHGWTRSQDICVGIVQGSQNAWSARAAALAAGFRASNGSRLAKA